MTDFLALQVQSLREAHPDLCCRPNSKFTHICMRALGHKGLCGWDGKNTQRRQSTSANLQQLWVESRLPFTDTLTSPVHVPTLRSAG